jgi:hypothetical protein
MHYTHEINWLKILGNAGTDFVLAASAINIFQINTSETYQIAFSLAIMKGLLAFFLEVKTQAEHEGRGEYPIEKPPSPPSMLLLF